MSSIGSSTGVGDNSGGRRGSRGRRLSGAGGTAAEGEGGRRIQPVEAFVSMENESAADLSGIVTTSLGAVKKVI